MTNFTGRTELLDQLRKHLTEQNDAVVLHALQGTGGVGKTQLAIEYIYRHARDYQVIWWVPCEQQPLMRSALAALAPRLDITGLPPEKLDDAINAVRDALRRGRPFDRWLLVFDNADQPEDLREVIPHGNGHVLVTSRNNRWVQYAKALEVDVFLPEESLDFLRRRVPGLSAGEANLLADELGHLPLALEQAGALMFETAMTVDTYISRLREEASKVLAQGTVLDYPVPMAAAWSISLERVRRQMPSAMALLHRIAYFGPEPISLDLINKGRHVLGPSNLRDTIRDPYKMSDVVREIGRYALARLDNLRRTLQMHRIIQTLIREDLDDDEKSAARHDVHLLLGGADPDRPDDLEVWPIYDDLLAHVGPSSIIDCDDGDVRRLATNMGRFLMQKGDFQAAQEWLARGADAWAAKFPDNDLHLLIMRRLLSNHLLNVGRIDEAFDLGKDTLAKLRAEHGEDHDETLLMLNVFGGILRAQGKFAAALDSDTDSVPRHQRVFTSEHPNTFRARNNQAIDHALVADYEEALRLDQSNYEDRLNHYGSDTHPQVLYTRNAIARDLRLLGRYHQARQEGERTYLAYQDLVIQQKRLIANHTDVLLQARELSVARRKAGAFDEAYELARDVFHRHRDTYGREHPGTLAAGVTLANGLRLIGNHVQSASFSRDTASLYRATRGEDYPFTYGCALNTAIALRLTGEPGQAKSLLEVAQAGLSETLGEDHHYTLTCATNLASTAAELGEHKVARRIGEEILERFREVLGPDHPHTLACAANLGADMISTGDVAKGQALRADVVERFGATLGADYHDVQAMEEGRRIDFDFEPPVV
ncbi:FxSxx-COOH system tetratricopeptide repeat protein [Herbidospora mongoliensis]|uniref:FxSxx-COOH system tetratricopeptide repeat protein n=1 Tax=Herbidospora mongoliensis TaxID=688067 RepID=UPI001C3F4D37|nr:FxSxx-COOH system tetratricopeptide repeat protein [Herbidospora mongoliensis]